MNKKLKPASRLSVIFILVVVLSGSILTWFSINNISNLKELTEKRVSEEQRELSNRFLTELQNTIEKVTAGFENDISPDGLLKDSLVEKGEKFDFIIQPIILNEKGDFLYPNFSGIPESRPAPKFSSRFKTAFSDGEKAEFAKNNFKIAKKNYLLCLSISRASQDSAKAINALGRVLVKLNEHENAIRQYNSICLNYFNVSDENGIPYVYYAVPQLLKISNSENIQKLLPVFEFCLEKMKNGTIPMNFNSEELVTQVLESVQKFSQNSSEKIAHLIALEKSIKQQVGFINEYRDELPKLIENKGINTNSSVSNDFKVLSSFTESKQDFFLINTDFTNPAGFLIDQKKLLDKLVKSELQNGFEFEYHIEFPNGYHSNSSEKNLAYSEPLNPYLPGCLILMQPVDENLVTDLIQRRSWIYGIATVLLLVAMVLGVVLIVRDIAREKRLALLQSNFISNVTHELKTPITSISMFAETILLKRVKKESDKEEYLSIILKESERLKRMINNILEFSKLEKGKTEYNFVESNLAFVMRSALQELSYWFEKERFEVVSELDDKIVAVVDPEKMKQVFENLLNNAIKYSAQNKKVTTRLYQNTKAIHIEIEDKGIGIPENELAQIFEKFYRINHKDSISGTGLGLTVVKEIVEAHDGTIDVTSKVGKGSKFSIIVNQQTNIG